MHLHRAGNDWPRSSERRSVRCPLSAASARGSIATPMLSTRGRGVPCGGGSSRRRRLIASPDGIGRRGRCRGGGRRAARPQGRRRDPQRPSSSSPRPHPANDYASTRASPGRSPGGYCGALRLSVWIGWRATWTILMNPDGAMTVQAPSTFIGVLGGYRFQPHGVVFRTTCSLTTSAGASRGGRTRGHARGAPFQGRPRSVRRPARPLNVRAHM